MPLLMWLPFIIFSGMMSAGIAGAQSPGDAKAARISVVD